MNVHCSICGVNEARCCCQSHIFSQILGSHIELLNWRGISKWGLTQSPIPSKIWLDGHSPTLQFTQLSQAMQNFLLPDLSHCFRDAPLATLPAWMERWPPWPVGGSRARWSEQVAETGRFHPRLLQDEPFKFWPPQRLYDYLIIGHFSFGATSPVKKKLSSAQVRDHMTSSVCQSSFLPQVS